MIYLSDKQVAERLGVSTSTLHRNVKLGKFMKPIELFPGTKRWLEASVAVWQREKAEEAMEREQVDAAYAYIEGGHSV